MANASRREFLKKAARMGVGGLTWGSTGFSMLSIGSDSIDDSDTSPVKEQREDDNNEVEPGVVIDREICGIPFKLNGVEHTREFAEKYFDSLEELVKNASIVVNESRPDNLKGMPNHFRAYRNTIFELCQKYDRPVYYFDPRSMLGIGAEAFTGILGVVIANDGVSKTVKSTTRRGLMKNLSKTTVGLYLFGSCLFTSLAIRELGLRLGGSLEYLERTESLFMSHVVDQRNVELANRLLRFAKKTDQRELSRGEYVLFDYGKAHAFGVDRYLDSPLLRKIKTALYFPTYNLIDSNSCYKFTPSAGDWVRTEVEL